MTHLRNFKIMDETGIISVAVWGIETTLKLTVNKIIAIKKALIRSYGGKSLTVGGYIELDPKHAKIDELKKFKHEKNATFKAIIDKTKSITDDSLRLSKRDWSVATTKTIQQMKKVQDAYYFTNKMPLETTFKVLAQITKVKNNMFYTKNNEQNWCLKVVLQEENEDDDISVSATAFGKAAQQIMNGLTAVQASEMQHNDFEKFVAVVNSITEIKENYIFGIFLKENTYNQQEKKIDFIIETIEKVN